MARMNIPLLTSIERFPRRLRFDPVVHADGEEQQHHHDQHGSAPVVTNRGPCRLPLGEKRVGGIPGASTPPHRFRVFNSSRPHAFR